MVPVSWRGKVLGLWGVNAGGYRVSFWGDVLELDNGDGYKA